MKQKKLLSGLLASLFLVGSMAISVAAFNDDASITNKDAVDGCVTLKIINGRDDGSFDPTAPVTRAEMAKMITVILNGGKAIDVNANATADFTDTTDHWALTYIAYCADADIVAGMGDGTFAPNASVTGAQVAKMLLVTLGYDAKAEGYVGEDWFAKVDAKATELTLYANLAADLDKNTALSRDNAAQMIWNALSQKTVKYETATGEDGVEVTTLVVEETALKDKYYTDAAEGDDTKTDDTKTDDTKTDDTKTDDTKTDDTKTDDTKTAA